VTKSTAQLDAEIAEALRTGKSNFKALISQIEKAVDAHPELTREHVGKSHGTEKAALRFSDDTWTARCGCRNRLAKGRGSRLMSAVDGHGDTPEEAVDDLIDKIPIVAEAIK
jgi:hypothetical protein